MKMFRVIDANANRVSEGIRVLEDLARFYFNSESFSSELRAFRHKIRKGLKHIDNFLLKERDAENDVGLDISRQYRSDNKSNPMELVSANFKRVQEGLRVIEEMLKTCGYYELSKEYEKHRFYSYILEKRYRTLLLKKDKLRYFNSGIYGITAEEYSKGRSNLEVVREMLKAGIRIIQYREKEKKMKEKYRECREIRKMTQDFGALFVVNDHVDLAIAVESDGIHIGQDDLPIEEVRKIAGDEIIIGLSTHSPEQARDAVARGADYIGVGPIFRTYTKKDVCEPVGLEYLDFVVKNLNIPFVAIGGIKEHNLEEVCQHGARCIAMVTEIVGADDIGKKVAKLQNIMAKYHEYEIIKESR